MQDIWINEKVCELINIIKVLRGTWWGGHAQILLTVYRALIRIEYRI